MTGRRSERAGRPSSDTSTVLLAFALAATGDRGQLGLAGELAEERLATATGRPAGARADSPAAGNARQRGLS